MVDSKMLRSDIAQKKKGEYFIYFCKNKMVKC